jgi:plasmid maintenance system antidote protein VapI
MTDTRAMHSIETVLRELERKVAASGTQRRYAAQIGVSQQYLCDVLRGRRGVSAELAQKLGYERLEVFRKVRRSA